LRHRDSREKGQEARQSAASSDPENTKRTDPIQSHDKCAIAA